MQKIMTKKKKTLIILLSVGVLAVLAGIFLLAVAVFGLEIKVGIGKTPVLPFISVTSTTVDDIPTDMTGTTSYDAKLFGVMPFSLKINVVDDAAPIVKTRNLTVPTGFELVPEDFIASVADQSPVSYEFVRAPDTSSNGTVSVKITDAFKNSVTVSADFTADSSIPTEVTVQCGCSIDALPDALKGFDISEDSLGVCHTFKSFRKLKNSAQITAVNVVDTTPPSARAVSHDILKGQTLTAHSFVSDIDDASEVEVAFKESPDFEKLGKQNITVIITDKYHNATEVGAYLNVYGIEDSVTVEAGTDYEQLSELIKELLDTDASLPRITDSFEPLHKSPGVYETEIVGEYSSIPFKVIVEDTVPPKVKLRKLTILAGEMPRVVDFVEECSDASSVRFEFKEPPVVDKAGNFLVTVVATDRAGNVTEAGTVLKVTRDDIPPIIYGVSDISVYEGETVSYRNGVYAVDDRDGQMSVKVNASGVNTNTPGTYYITYTATDSEGNTSTAAAELTVKPVTIKAVYDLADEVLDSILTDSMTDKEKARAVYDWCRSNIRYSNATSHLMGYYAKAAHSGLSRKYGNCYTYYAVSGVLLSRAGITNIMIQRNSNTDPHYWNLVNMDGAWYHFDTCPQPAPYNLEVFLLTDSQVREFSRTCVKNYYNFNPDDYPATP